ncbi:hypothetical protein [Streptomyces sp. NPDC018957]
MSRGICDGRVVVVRGGRRGVGRVYGEWPVSLDAAAIGEGE